MADTLPVVRGTFSDSASSGEAATLVTGADTKVGDLLVAWEAIDWETGAAMGPPTGTAGTWTELHAPTLSDLGTNLPHLKAWYRRVTVAGAQRVTFGAKGSADIVTVVVVLDGATIAPGAAAIDAATGTKNAATVTPHTVPSVAMVGDRDRLLFALASGLNSSTAAGIDYTPISPAAELREIDSAAWITLAVGTLGFNGAGNSGAGRGFTPSVARYYVGAVVAIRGATTSNPITVDLAPVRALTTTQPGAEFLKTGQTRDMPAVRGRHILQRLTAERDVEVAPVRSDHRWQRPVVEHGMDLGGAPLRVGFAFPKIEVTNLTVTPIRLRIGALPADAEIVPITPLTDRTKRPTSQTYVRPRKNIRYLVQEVLSRKWVSWDFGLREPELTWNVNAANEITGKVDASELARLGIDEWSHYLHVEQNGEIRNSGIILPWTIGGPEIAISAAGVTRYPHGISYQGNFPLGTPVGQNIDPLDVVRHCWQHLQTYPDGRLGVRVAATTSPVRIGEAPRDVNFTAGGTPGTPAVPGTDPVTTVTKVPGDTGLKNAAEELLGHIVRGGTYFEDFTFRGCSSNLLARNDDLADGYYVNGARFESAPIRAYLQRVIDANATRTVTTTTPGTPGAPAVEGTPGEEVAFTAGPYLLKWYEETDIGGEIDDLAKETPFDYREAPRWNDAKTDVEQWIELGYPRLGRDQRSIAFAEGQNLIVALAPAEDDERYASEVVALGKGEGTGRVRGIVTTRVGKRVRRSALIEVKNADTTSRARALAGVDLASRHGQIEVDEVHLLGNHPLAPFGSFAAGDDVPVRMTVEGYGPVVVRHRVTGYTYKPEVSDIVARTKRSDSFSYSGGTE